MIRIDHVFVCVGAPRAHVPAIVGAGLVEGSGNVHPGQGTANARFFFRESFFEVLWETNRAEIESPAVAPTRLAERCRGSACPFGVALGGLPEDAPWGYAAPFFFPDGRTIPVWSEPNSDGPFIFSMGGMGGLRGADRVSTEPRNDAVIEAVELHGPFGRPPALPEGPVSFHRSDVHRMRLRLSAALEGPLTLPDELRVELFW